MAKTNKFQPDSKKKNDLRALKESRNFSKHKHQKFVED